MRRPFSGSFAQGTDPGLDPNHDDTPPGEEVPPIYDPGNDGGFHGPYGPGDRKGGQGPGGPGYFQSGPGMPLAQDYSGNFQNFGGEGGGGFTNWAAYTYANQQPEGGAWIPKAGAGATPGMQNLDAGLNQSFYAPALATGATPPAAPAQGTSADGGGALSSAAPGQQAPLTFLGNPAPQAPDPKRQGFSQSMMTTRSF